PWLKRTLVLQRNVGALYAGPVDIFSGIERMVSLGADVGGPCHPVAAELLLHSEIPLLRDRIDVVLSDHVKQRIRGRAGLRAAGEWILERQVRQERLGRPSRKPGTPGGSRAPRRIEDIDIGAGIAAVEVVIYSPA